MLNAQKVSASCLWSRTISSNRDVLCICTELSGRRVREAITLQILGCQKIFWSENFCPKMQNLGAEKPPFGENIGTELKFCASIISFVWNLQLSIEIPLEICSVCPKIATCALTTFSIHDIAGHALQYSPVQPVFLSCNQHLISSQRTDPAFICGKQHLQKQAILLFGYRSK